MHDPQLSVLEISRIVEQAMLPYRCSCTSNEGLTLRIQVACPDSPQEPLAWVVVSIAELNSSRALSRLVTQLREQISHAEQQPTAALGQTG